MLDNIGPYLVLLFIACVIVGEFVVTIVVSTAFASYLHVSGLLWWCIAILTFCFINLVLNALMRVGKE